MNALKKYVGIFWIILALFAIWFLFNRAIDELSAEVVKPDKKIFWYSILPVYVPLMLGLALFGWYALQGEYDRIEE